MLELDWFNTVEHNSGIHFKSAETLWEEFREIKQKPSCYVFVRVYVNLRTVTVIEFIICLPNKAIIQ